MLAPPGDKDVLKKANTKHMKPKPLILIFNEQILQYGNEKMKMKK